VNLLQLNSTCEGGGGIAAEHSTAQHSTTTAKWGKTPPRATQVRSITYYRSSDSPVAP
jgi:hypothetical protein